MYTNIFDRLSRRSFSHHFITVFLSPSLTFRWRLQRDCSWWRDGRLRYLLGLGAVLNGK